MTATGTTAVTLALVAGMPYVLWRSSRLPWPTQVPSWSEFGARLLQPVSDPLMLDLLAIVGWACWAAFMGTLLREICWYAAHLPDLVRSHLVHQEHLTALSARRSLAALCVGTLLVALISMWRPYAADAAEPSALGTAPLPVVATAPAVPGAVGKGAVGTAARASTQQGEGHGAERLAHAPRRYVEHTVAAGDTLWDLAHRHLGDPFKWPRIYALNKDRQQPDGGRLHDPDLLGEGWKLTIPIANPVNSPLPPPHGGDTRPPRPPFTSPHIAPKETPPNQTGGGPRHAQPHHQARERFTERASDDGGKGSHASDVGTVGLGEAGLIGITAAAGLLAARRYWNWHRDHRRGLNEQAETDPPPLSPLVHRAMEAAHAATRPRTAEDEEDEIVRPVSPQRPRSGPTVLIGSRGGVEVSLDELAVPGGCRWTGPGAEAAARALLVGVLTAAERQRPGTARVQAVVPRALAERLVPGLPARFSALTHVADIDDAIRAVEQHLLAHARAQDATGPAPAFPLQAQDAGPGTLLLLVCPGAAHVGQVQALAARSHPRRLIVLALDVQLPDAQHWHIAEDGTTPQRGDHDRDLAPLNLFRLKAEAVHDISEFLLTAHGERLAIESPPPPPAPVAEQPQEAPASGAAQANVPPAPADFSRPRQEKPIRLHVLGPITLYARGTPDPIGTNLRGEAREFLALLAAHPKGLLASDIIDKLHLAPDGAQTALKNLRRAVRRALRAATGITSQEFVLLRGELHCLHPGLVETDLLDFTESLKCASSDEDLDSSISAAHSAMAHYAGPFAQGGDYFWADAVRENFAAEAIDTVLRLARRIEKDSLSTREADQVLKMLEHLGNVHPDRERLAQHAIRLYQASGRHDAASHTYSRLKRSLSELGLEPDIATQALVGAGKR
ncbi:BTAD domain-containing putative transcriptional regulator [Streptomyces sp. NPDC050560]|uniref:BTAD domain-containing putative transcriptional regulator n=1 Tax=Streptomyces sp. NPDC050560 TaxID=3365630 RepID=UPI0037B462C8